MSCPYNPCHNVQKKKYTRHCRICPNRPDQNAKKLDGSENVSHRQTNAQKEPLAKRFVGCDWYSQMLVGNAVKSKYPLCVIHIQIQPRTVSNFVLPSAKAVQCVDTSWARTTRTRPSLYKHPVRWYGWEEAVRIGQWFLFLLISRDFKAAPLSCFIAKTSFKSHLL